MTEHDRHIQPGPSAPGPYTPPRVVVLGTLAELTQVKEVGAADGTVFQGIDLGT